MNTLRFRFVFFTAVFLSAFGSLSSFSQQAQPIKKSDKIEISEGKKYYMHTVEKGQTLYSIAKTYNTTVDIVLANNPEAIEGLKTGGRLKIPFVGEMKKDIKDSKEKREQKKDDADFLPVPEKKDSAAKTIAPPPEVKPIGDIHVALFLPLSLNFVNDIDVSRIAKGDEKLPEEVKIGVEFYEGIKMAFDSLKKAGFKGALHVYDTNLDSAGFVKLLKKPELKEMDLFIGPLYGKRFESILKIAKANSINIVAPAIQGNHILMGNPNVSKVTPSYVTQAEELAGYIAEKHISQNILIFNSTNSKDKPYINTFKKTANSLLKQPADSVTEVTFVTLKTFISKTEPNIVVIPSTNQSFITEAVNKLYQHKHENIKDSLLVFGMSNWMDMESLDFGYLKTLHATVSSYSFVDYTSPSTKKIIEQYRREYRTDPSEFVFSGFDIGYYYLSGLQQYGNSLQQKLPEIKHKGIQTEFNFFQADPSASLGAGSGYENRGVGIMKFENYSYVRVK